MSFKSTIVVVDDIGKSKKLYVDILKCKIKDDFGKYNIGFYGGLALYNRSLYKKLIGHREIIGKSHNFSIYFEYENIDYIQEKIRKNNLEFIHEIREQPWGSRAFRFYDYDGNVIEVAEKMDYVIKRMLNQELSLNEISVKTGYSKEDIKNICEID